MSDAIYRQQAIDTIKELREVAWKNWHEPTLSPNMVIDALSGLPSAPSRTGKWIPVTERSPEDYTDVLVWFEYFRYGDYNCLYQTYGIGDYSTKYNSWMINHETGWHKLRVIAWMPLPQPYTEETNAQNN